MSNDLAPISTGPTDAATCAPCGVRLPTTAAAALAALIPAPGESFIATRFPFTYAYDFLRENPEAFSIPLEPSGSRGRMAGFIRSHTADDNDRLQVIHAAAEAYLIHHRVRLPAGNTPSSLAATSLTEELLAASARASCSRALPGDAP